MNETITHDYQTSLIFVLWGNIILWSIGLYICFYVDMYIETFIYTNIEIVYQEANP